MSPYIHHEDQQIHKPERVWYTGSTALLQGVGVCFVPSHSDVGTGELVTDPWPKRARAVEDPSELNALLFAGIVATPKAAKVGGQWIEILTPGSVCQVRTDQNCTIDTTFLTCLARTDTGAAGAVGVFYKFGFPGRGSAQCLQTVNRSAVAGLVLARLMDGPESGLVESLIPVDNAAMTDPMGSGVTFLDTVITIGAGNSTATLADGEANGVRKAIISDAAITTSDVDLTISHHSTSDPEHLFFDADGEATFLVWCDTQWAEISLTAAEA